MLQMLVTAPLPGRFLQLMLQSTSFVILSLQWASKTKGSTLTLNRDEEGVVPWLKKPQIAPNVGWYQTHSTAVSKALWPSVSRAGLSRFNDLGDSPNTKFLPIFFTDWRQEKHWCSTQHKIKTVLGSWTADLKQIDNNLGHQGEEHYLT